MLRATPGADGGRLDGEGEGGSGSGGPTCAICLSSIPPERECFLDACFHSFDLKCIKEWTAAQVRSDSCGQRFPAGPRSLLA